MGWESLAKDLRQPDEGNDYVFFPEDDVTVEVIHKTFRTVEDPTLVRSSLLICCYDHGVILADWQNGRRTTIIVKVL